MTQLAAPPNRSTPPAELPSAVANQLRRLAWRIRRLAILRGVGLAVAITTVMAAVALLADFYFDLPQPLRTAWLFATGFTLAAIVIWMIIRPLLKRYRGRDLAAVIEAAHPELDERLSTLVQITHAETPDHLRGSPVMVDRLTSETLAVSERIDFQNSISGKQSARIAILAAASLCVLLIPFLFAADNYRLLWARLVAPWGNYDRAGDIHFEVAEGDRVVPREADVTLRAVARSRSGQSEFPQEARLEFVSGAAAGNWRTADFDSASGSFVVTIPRVREDFAFVFTAGRARSRAYEVQVVDPPALATCVLHAEPPAYTGWAAQSFDGAIGEMSVFEGSRLRWELRFEDAVADAQLVRGPREAITAYFASAGQEHTECVTLTPMTFTEEGKAAHVDFLADHGGDFAVYLTDRHGFHNQPNVERRLRIVRDRPPEFLGGFDAEPLSLSPTEPLQVVALARDDISVARLELHLIFSEEETVVLEAPAEELAQPNIRYQFQFDLASRGMTPGSQFRYFLRACDNRPQPGPQWVTTAQRAVILEPDAGSIKEQELVRQQERMAQELAEIHEEVRRQEQQVARMGDEPQSDILQNSAVQQQQLAQRLQRLADEFAERPILAGLTEQTQAIADQQLSSAADSLRQASGEEGEQRQNSITSAGDRLEQAENQLAELRRRFERLAALERDLLDLDQLAARAQALSQQLAAIERQKAEIAAQEDSPEREQQLKALDEQQKQAAAEAAELAEKLKQLVEQHPEILEAARQARLKELGRLGHSAGAIANSQKELAKQVEQQPAAPGTETEPEDQKSEQEFWELLAAQRELTRDMIDFARQAAVQQGPQSPPAQQGLQMAAHADTATRAALAGQVEQAAQSAEQAAQTAEQVSSTTEQEQLQRGAEGLRRRQLALAKQFAELAADPDRRRAAQRMGQQNLTAQTEELQRQLKRSADDLEAEPLRMIPEAEQTRQAEQHSAVAGEQMKQAQNSMEQNRPGPAAEQGREAAGLLDEVAKAIQQLTGEQSGGEQMPGDAAEDIAQAMQQMQQAQQQLAQQEGEQSSQNQQNGQKQGEQGQQDAADNVQQAAESLADATESLQQGQGQQQKQQNQGRRSQQTGQAASPGNAAGGAGSNAESSELEALREEFEALSARHWGELPGRLRTEIQHATTHRAVGDYANLIRRYFKELAKTRRGSEAVEK